VRVEPYFSDTDSVVVQHAATSPRSQRAAAGPRATAKLWLLSWNLGAEIQFARFPRDVWNIASVVNAAYADAKRAGAELVVAFQEFDLGPPAPAHLPPGAESLRKHKVLKTCFDPELRWVDEARLDGTRFSTRALLVSKGCKVERFGYSSLEGSPNVEDRGPKRDVNRALPWASILVPRPERGIKTVAPEATPVESAIPAFRRCQKRAPAFRRCQNERPRSWSLAESSDPHVPAAGA